MFKDITPLLADPAAFGALTDALAGLCAAARRHQGRRPGGARLHPRPPRSRSAPASASSPSARPASSPERRSAQAYDLEYGTAEIEVHAEDLRRGRPRPGHRRRPRHRRHRRGVAAAHPPGGRRGRGRRRADGAGLPGRPRPAGAGSGGRPAGGPAHGLSARRRPRRRHRGPGATRDARGHAQAGPEDPGPPGGVPTRSRRPAARPPPGIDTMGSPEPDRGTRIAHEECSCQTRPSQLAPSASAGRNRLRQARAPPRGPAAQPAENAASGPAEHAQAAPRRARPAEPPRPEPAPPRAPRPAPPAVRPAAGQPAPLRLLQPRTRPPGPARRAALQPVQPGPGAAAADRAQQRPQDRDGARCARSSAPTRSPSAGTAARSARAATRTSRTRSRSRRSSPSWAWTRPP